MASGPSRAPVATASNACRGQRRSRALTSAQIHPPQWQGPQLRPKAATRATGGARTVRIWSSLIPSAGACSRTYFAASSCAAGV